MKILTCKLAELSLNLDMSGRITPCNLNSQYLKDDNYNDLRLDKDSLKTAWNSITRKKLMNALAKGIPHPRCKICWNMEEIGSESARQRFNRELSDIEPLPDQPRIIIMKHGNKCNSACRSCSQHSSTLWYKDAYVLTAEPKPAYKEWLKQFRSHETSFIDNKNLSDTLRSWSEHIIFFDMYGGEPLLHPLTFEILGDSVSRGIAPDQTIQIHINGTIYDKRLKEWLPQFKEARIGFSVDAIGDRNDYIRWPSKWDQIMENLSRYLEDFRDHDNVKIKIAACGMSHNVYYLYELYQYFTDMGISIGFTNRVTDKHEANMMYLPTEIKEKVKEHLLSADCKDPNWIDQRDCTVRFLSKTPTDHAMHQDAFWYKNQLLDKMRNQDYSRDFPEFAEILAKHYKVLVGRPGIEPGVL